MKTMILTLATLASTAALADMRVEMNGIDTKGVGAPMGTVKVTEAKGGGVTFTPDLKGLPPGTHGFHVHEVANCGAKEQEGKMVAGAMAGPHWDPDKAGKHGAHDGSGHRGDLPALEVGGDGTAKKAITAPRLKMADLANKSLMVHAGGDNYSDQPKPNGGGGDRIACGLFQAAQKP